MTLTSLVVKGGGSQSRGCVFESQRRVLDGHFSQYFAVNGHFLIEKSKNKTKRDWG